MRRLTLFTITFITFFILAAAVISVVVVFRMEEKRVPDQVTERADFIRAGNLSPSEGEWKLVYEEPGKPALAAPLLFSDKSECGSSVCDAASLVVGARVAVEGVLTADGKVRVTRLTPSD